MDRIALEWPGPAGSEGNALDRRGLDWRGRCGSYRNASELSGVARQAGHGFSRWGMDGLGRGWRGTAGKAWLHSVERGREWFGMQRQVRSG